MNDFERVLRSTLSAAAAFFGSDRMAQVMRANPELAKRLADNVAKDNVFIEKLQRGRTD